MSNCGCGSGSGGGGGGSSGCVCRIDSSPRISVTGVGSTISPFSMDLILDPATDNAASLTADGLFVQAIGGPVGGGGDVFYNADGGVVVFDDGLDNTAATHAFSLDGDATVITVLDQRYNANSVEMAVADNTPVNLQFTPMTVLGMGSSGNLRLVDWSELGGGGTGGSGLQPDAFGNWDMGTSQVHLVGGNNLIYPGVIRQTGGVSVATSYLIQGTDSVDDPQIGTAFLARIDQILDNTDAFGFIGPHGFAPAFPFPNKFKGQPSTIGFPGPPAAVFECEGVTQYARDATGFASMIAFQNTKLIKNVSGVSADIAGHQGFLNIPAYMADGATIAMARCGPNTVGGPMSLPIGGEFARDGVVALHQGYCDYPAFTTDMVNGGALNDVVLVSFSSIATFGQGASGAMRHGFRYEDAQTNLHPCLTNETWHVLVTTTSGNITLTFGSQTATVAFNASRPAIQQALEALSSIGAGNVSVTSYGLAFQHYVEFVGALKDTNLGDLTGTGVTITNLQQGGKADFWDANILGFETLGTLTKQIAVNIPFLEGAVINIGLHNGSTTVNAPTPTQTVTAGSLIKANTSHARITSAAHMTFNGTADTVGGGFEDGQEMKVSNVGVFDITFVDIASFPSCGLSLPGKNKLTLKPLESMTISWWDAFNLWYVVGATPGTVVDTGLLHTNTGVATGRMKISDYGSLALNTVQLEAYAGVDTFPRINIGTASGFGVINFGPGSAATDTTLIRTGTASLTLTGAAGGTGDLTAAGSVTSPRFTASGITGATPASGTVRWVGGTTTGAPTTGTFVAGDHVVTQAGRMWVCVSGGTPGIWIMVGSNYPDAVDLNTGTTTGTKIGGATNQKIGFWGKAPVVQQARPTDTISIIALLVNLGLCA